MSMRHGYVKPVKLVESLEQEKKSRTVTIYKNKVYKDIDLYTHKHVDASDSQNVQARNAVSSDTAESVDGAVISQYVEFRDARLRDLLQFALKDDMVAAADNSITLEEETYLYEFEVKDSFRDITLKTVAQYMHRYLVFGALSDWYGQFGDMKLSEYYGMQANALEETIKSIMRGPSIAKRPLQPFGPQKPM